MAFLEVNLIQEGADGNADRIGTRRYTKVYRVDYDAFNEGSGDAISHIPVAKWDYYGESGGYVDYGALAEEVTAAPEAPSESYAWLVTVRYSSELWDQFQANVNSGGTSPIGAPPSKPSSGGGGGETPANPLNMPGRFSFGSAKGRRALEREYVLGGGGLWEETGRPIANSAGDRFDPPAERDETYRTIVFVRNELLTESRMLGYDEYADTVNAASFLGREPRTVKCEMIDYVSESQNNVDFWVVTYSFIWRKQGWDLKPLDEGVHEIVAGVRSCIKDSHGIPITNPVPLNGTGGQLDPADDPIYFDGTGTNPLPFAMYPDADFTLLNIPWFS